MKNSQLLAALVLILHACLSNSFLIQSTRHTLTNTGCASSGRFQTSIFANRIADKNLSEISFEEMVKTVELEEKEKALAAKRETTKKKKEAVQKKKDKEYESFWNKQKKTPKSREAMEKLYYSLGDDETLSQKLKKSAPKTSTKISTKVVLTDEASPIVDEDEFSSKDVGALAGAVLGPLNL